MKIVYSIFWVILAMIVVNQVSHNHHAFDMAMIAWLTPAIICVFLAIQSLRNKL